MDEVNELTVYKRIQIIKRNIYCVVVYLNNIRILAKNILIMNKNRECKKCGNLITGRADKVFCNDYCRNSYNNVRCDYLDRLYKITKKRAKKEGINFNIELSDLIIPKLCPIFKIPLFRGNGKRSNNSPSLDRIIPELGYVKGNVWIISDRANRMKSDMNEQDIINFCTILLDKINFKNIK